MATNSIKSFLLVNLLLSVTLVSTLAIVGNLFLEHQGFQKNLDSQLSLAAHTINAFSKNINNFTNIQSSITDIDIANSKNTINDSIQYLILDNKYQTLLTSKSVPKFSTRNIKPGFNDLWLNRHPWRLFHLSNKNLKIYTLQRHDFRAKLEKEITEESFIIMLITYPFLGILIWAVVNKGLASLEAAAEALRRRKSSNLKPLKIANPPSEVIPLINSINSLLHRLEEAFQREQRFAGDAAHELRTPLAALSAHLQLAQKENDPQKIKDGLAKVFHGVERSAHVVDQLLTLSRTTPESQINQPEQIRLSDLAKEIIIELLPHADKKNITVELNSNSNCNVTGNRSALLIMLRNLLDNALRYSPKNSAVTIEIASNKTTVSISINDQGPGIPTELKNRVFERFFRVIGNNTKGSGLGLGIVKQIADIHNATINLKNTNPGLEFKVSFPK